MHGDDGAVEGKDGDEGAEEKWRGGGKGWVREAAGMLKSAAAAIRKRMATHESAPTETARSRTSSAAATISFDRDETRTCSLALVI